MISPYFLQFLPNRLNIDDITDLRTNLQIKEIND